MHEIDNKEFFKNYAFFLVILLVIFGILSYSVVLSRKSWTKNLGVSVQKVLDEYEPSVWNVEAPVNLKKPISVNCAAYQIRNKTDGSVSKAVIVRITTFYGPLPAVYIYTEGQEAQFIGYSSLHGRIKNQLVNNNSDKRREYWQAKIPDILK